MKAERCFNLWEDWLFEGMPIVKMTVVAKKAYQKLIEYEIPDHLFLNFSTPV